jgi:uncharacterized membrane protein
MPSATSEIIIERPPEEVFSFLADPENDPQWRSGVLDIKRVSGSGVGARYAQGVKGPGGRRIPADIELTELIAGESIAFQTLTGPVRPRGRYAISTAERGTHVRFELDADLKGLKRLMAPMVQRTMNREVGQLDRLKRAMEQA